MLQYRPRQVQWLGLITVQSYTFKHYGLKHEAHLAAAQPPTVTVKNVLARELDAELVSDHRIGFVITHLGADANYLLVSRWMDSDLLHHRVVAFEREDSNWSRRREVPRGVIACVWELGIMAFERNAWIETALHRGGGADSRQDYLEAHFTGWI